MEHIGTFDTAEAAAVARDAAALERYGEFAVLNFADDTQRPTPQRVTRLANGPQRRWSGSTRSASGYRGVRRNGNRWEARLCVGNQVVYLGSFGTAEAAASAYDQAASETLGDVAVLNNPAAHGH